MGFSAKQVKALRRNLDHRYVRSREANGRELSYIEGWYAISEANRIFGFDGWSRETLESRCVLARENRGAFVAVYTARVRISVSAGGITIIREGHGSGEGRGPPLVKFMILHLRLWKPMLPNAPWLRSVDHSDLSFIAKTKTRFLVAHVRPALHCRRPVSACIPTIRRPSHDHRNIMADGIRIR